MTTIDGFVKRRAKIAFDSNVLIGLFENTDYSDEAAAFFSAVQAKRAELWTSVMTVAEVLAEPVRRGQDDLVTQYEKALFKSTLSFAPINLATSRTAAYLGSRYRLPIRDALHLASLLDANVQGFVTADHDFAKVDILPVFIIAARRRQKHR